MIVFFLVLLAFIFLSFFMKKFQILFIFLISLTLLTACGGANNSDPDADPLDEGSAMGRSCEEQCEEYGSLVKKLSEQMIRDAGCEVGARDGELETGQSTGTIDGGSEYFCPDEKSTNAFAEATDSMSSRHKKALKNYKEKCPCMVQLFQCSGVCQPGTAKNLCILEFLGKEECLKRGGVPVE